MFSVELLKTDSFGELLIEPLNIYELKDYNILQGSTRLINIRIALVRVRFVYIPQHTDILFN